MAVGGAVIRNHTRMDGRVYGGAPHEPALIYVLEDGTRLPIHILNGYLKAFCPSCKKLVRVDKWLLGSLHLCQSQSGAA